METYNYTTFYDEVMKFQHDRAYIGSRLSSAEQWKKLNYITVEYVNMILDVFAEIQIDGQMSKFLGCKSIFQVVRDYSSIVQRSYEANNKAEVAELIDEMRIKHRSLDGYMREAILP